MPAAAMHTPRGRSVTAGRPGVVGKPRTFVAQKGLTTIERGTSTRLAEPPTMARRDDRTGRRSGLRRTSHGAGRHLGSPPVRQPNGLGVGLLPVDVDAKGRALITGCHGTVLIGRWSRPNGRRRTPFVVAADVSKSRAAPVTTGARRSTGGGPFSCRNRRVSGSPHGRRSSRSGVSRRRSRGR